jgi:hypothetical protein
MKQAFSPPALNARRLYRRRNPHAPCAGRPLERAKHGASP